jgi:hypothetical protein
MPSLAPDFMEWLAETENDPSAFSELVFGTPLHAGQVRFTTEKNGQVNFLLPGNSWGKTEFITRVTLWEAWFKKGYNFWHDGEFDFEAWVQQKWEGLICSYEYDIAQESFNRLKLARRNRPEVAALIDRLSDSDYEMDLTNGSHVDWGSLSEQGKHVEAKRYVRIKVDEAGHIPDLSYTYDSILYPRTMGVGGVIDLFGTPKAHSDPYLLEVYEKGKNGGDGFYFSQAGSVLENEFWPKEEQDRVLLNPRYVNGWVDCEWDPPSMCNHPICRNGKHPVLTPIGRQVLLGDFVLAGGLMFNRLHINRLFAWEEEFGDPVWVGDNHFAMPAEKGHLYHAAFDLGGNKPRRKKKQGSDATVGFVIDYTTKPWRVVRYDYIPGGDADWEQKYDLMQEVYETYEMPYLCVDATGQVDSIVEALYRRGVEVEGIHFGGTGNKKFDMLRNLQLIMELDWGTGEKGALKCPPIPQVKHELEIYRLPDEDIQQDTVMALAMVGHQIAQYELPAPTAGEVW